MQLHGIVRQCLASVAVAAMLSTSLPVGVARAGLVPTDQVIDETFGTAPDEAMVEAILGRAEVQEQLAAMGVDPAEAAERLRALSDSELAAIADELDELPAGQGVFTTIAIVAGVVLVVLIITDLAGITNVFTFIR